MNNNKNLLPQYEIEAFDPNESLTVVQKIDEQGQVKETLFMRFQESLAWFLTVYPEGCLTHVFNKLDEHKATVTASVYRSANDARAAATATCTRYYDESINGTLLRAERRHSSLQEGSGLSWLWYAVRCLCM